MRSRVQIFNHDCLADIANGDQEAFCKFFHAFKNKIYSFSYSFTKSQQVAEEITQDVFTKVWTNRESLCEIENIDAWLSTITKNLCFNYLKKLALERKTKDQLLKTRNYSDENVEQYLSYKEKTNQLAEALDQLSPQQRLIFTLNRDKGLKNGEIADQLHLSPSTVKTHMVNALRKIRTILESHTAHLFGVLLIFLKNF
ncbi:MAG TPA: RNA polymerase sigma-70 factor [Flavisolibacter sp.]|jgi:RNA polymerase sigma-70 factor (ECF subfamily)|nr:RNA polymerase sigma-70 factor [Flavisolibacter sp.]